MEWSQNAALHSHLSYNLCLLCDTFQLTIFMITVPVPKGLHIEDRELLRGRERSSANIKGTSK